MNRFEKVYLGDGVYISFDGDQYRLTTENGIEETNVIFMDPDVVRRFLEYERITNAKVQTKGSPDAWK